MRTTDVEIARDSLVLSRDQMLRRIEEIAESVRDLGADIRALSYEADLLRAATHGDRKAK